jgi:hypothetical protein
MRRFSDRLTSSSFIPQDQGKTIAGIVKNGSDENKTNVSRETVGSNDRQYTSLVGMLGLHQTVNTLQAEYRAVTGGNSNGPDDRKSTAG